MTESVKSVSNGSKAAPSTPERKTGMAKVREAEAYHVVSVAHDAAFEAERLCDDIYRTASDAYFGRGEQNEAAQLLASPEMQRKIQDAFGCLDAAQDHLRHLIHCGETPF